MLPASLYEVVFNASATGQYLLSATPDAIILAVNDAFLAASARRREDLIGISLFAAFPGNPDDPDDSGEVALRGSLARVIASRLPDTLPNQRYPIRVTLPDGQVRYEERYWSAVNTPIIDAAGRIVCIAHSTTDVTDQLRLQNTTSASEKRFRALINATGDVIYRMSPDWTYMHELDGRGFLKTTTSLAEYKIEEYVHPQDLAQARAAIDAAIRNKSVFELEHRVLRADGGYGWTFSRAVPILDAAGELLEWVGSASDITERKAAVQQLIEQGRRKDEFLAMLAHELRNPLAPISAAAQLLQLRALSEERLRHTCKIIERQVAHMTNLVDELLDASRVSRGLVKLDKVALDMRQVVTEAVEQITPLIQLRRHQLDLQLSAEPGFVIGDKKRLVQTIANLLNNAAKFTPEGGRLQLRTEVLAHQIRVEVRDNGMGMTPETANNAFELFSQAERSSDRSLGGLGLGLALVASLVALHDGTVGCESAGLGLGSTFTLRLPRLLAEQTVGDGLREQAVASGAGHSLNIMVVDDNQDAAEMLAMLLTAVGHQVVVEHGAAQALQRAGKAAPQVCLLDIGLPEMDGNELAQRLRALPATAGAVLIAVTGYGQDSDRQRSLAAGFDHHLVKPVEFARLAAILATIPK